MIPRRISHQGPNRNRHFNYDLAYADLNLRQTPELYKVGIGEQGVLLVEPYKSEILPHWKFKNPEVASSSATKISALFHEYKCKDDFVGMDMARKFLQMGFTRSRRYANHKSGRKYDSKHRLLAYENDAVKARSAEIFWAAWQETEADETYSMLKVFWKLAFG